MVETVKPAVKEPVKESKPRKKMVRTIPAGNRVALFQSRIKGLKSRIKALHTTARNLPVKSDEPNADKTAVVKACLADLTILKNGIDAVIAELQTGDDEDIFRAKQIPTA